MDHVLVDHLVRKFHTPLPLEKIKDFFCFLSKEFFIFLRGNGVWNFLTKWSTKT